MHTLPRSLFSTRQLLRGVSLIAALFALASTLSAQNDAAAGDNGGRQRRRQQNGDNADNGNGNGRGRGNFDPQQMQEQMLSRLREQFDVSDDAEWKLISERLLAVAEARRASGGGLGGAMMMFGRGGGQGGGGRGGRFGGGNPEADALRSAIQDKLPDAEIKSRLERLRESRKANEEKLAKAQEDLRAVLSVRQEAVAVMAGLLP